MNQGYQRTCFLLLLLALLWGGSACGSTEEYSEESNNAESGPGTEEPSSQEEEEEQVKPDAGGGADTGLDAGGVEDEEDVPSKGEAGSGVGLDDDIPDCPFEDEEHYGDPDANDDGGLVDVGPDLPGEEPDGSCRSSADCAEERPGAQCYRPGQSIGCGICMERFDECGQDSDCASGTVCELVSGVEQCLCNPAKLCVAACSPGSCEEGTVCKGDGRCGPIDCLDDSHCPDYFACSEAGECRRKACEGDATCDGGYCVERACYGNLGFCSYPPP